MARSGTAGKARVYRRRGRGTRTTWLSILRGAAAAYRRTSWRRRLMSAALLLGILAAGCVSQHVAPWLPVLIGAGVLFTLHLVLRFPGATATVLVLAAFAPLATPIGLLYTLAATNGRADFSTSGLTLLAASILVALLAHRTSRGRAWLTTLYALAAVALVGPLLLRVLPSLGFLVAYLCAGLVLFLRGGGWPRMRGTTRRLRRRFSRKPQEPRTQAAEEQATAALLADLDASHVVLHGLLLPNGTAADHLVVGPGGIFLIDSQARTGRVREDAKRGLVHRDEPLASSFAALLTARSAVATELHVPVDEITPLVVIHQARLPESRARVALFDPAGKRTGDVLVLAPDRLIPEIDTGIADLSPRRVKRLARRARRRLLPATAGQPNTTRPDSSAEAVESAVLDADGQRKPDPFRDGPAPQPMFTSPEIDIEVKVGQRVSLFTDQGVLVGLRVCTAPVTGEDDIARVGVCSETDWRTAQGRGEDPEPLLFPLASVRPE